MGIISDFIGSLFGQSRQEVASRRQVRKEALQAQARLDAQRRKENAEFRARELAERKRDLIVSSRPRTIIKAPDKIIPKMPQKPRIR